MNLIDLRNKINSLLYNNPTAKVRASVVNELLDDVINNALADNTIFDLFDGVNLQKTGQPPVADALSTGRVYFVIAAGDFAGIAVTAGMLVQGYITDLESGVTGFQIVYTPPVGGGSDATKLPLAGGTMTGDIEVGVSDFKVRKTGTGAQLQYFGIDDDGGPILFCRDINNNTAYMQFVNWNGYCDRLLLSGGGNWKGIVNSYDNETALILESLMHLRVLKSRYWTGGTSPTSDDDESRGFVANKSIWLAEDTGNSWLCIDNTFENALWIPHGIVCGKISLDESQVEAGGFFEFAEFPELPEGYAWSCIEASASTLNYAAPNCDGGLLYIISNTSESPQFINNIIMMKAQTTMHKFWQYDEYSEMNLIPSLALQLLVGGSTTLSTGTGVDVYVSARVIKL